MRTDRFSSESDLPKIEKETSRAYVSQVQKIRITGGDNLTSLCQGCNSVDTCK